MVTWRPTNYRQPNREETLARVHQTLLILATLSASWLGMQAMHELGHVLGGRLTGAKVARVFLSPLSISRTDFAVNPHPLLVVWAGPVFGGLFPLAAWGVAMGLGFRQAFLLRFFAGFCLIANGAYIAFGAMDKIGDCGEMLRHGAMLWQLWLFGAVAVPAGFYLWHRIGPNFGLGTAHGRVSATATVVSAAAFAALLILGLLVGGN